MDRTQTVLAIVLIASAFQAGLASGQNVESALYLSGAGDYITLGQHANLDFRAGVSVTLWVKPLDDLNRVLLNHYDCVRGGVGWRIVRDSPSEFQFSCKAGHYGIAVPTPANIWTHVAIVMSGGSLLGYANGVLTGKVVTPGSLLEGGGPIYVGKEDSMCGQRNYFRGLIDDLAIWNRAISDAQVQESMRGHLAGDENDLIAYYSFDSDDWTSGRELKVKDSSSYGNHGVIYGNPYVYTADLPVKLKLTGQAGSSQQVERSSGLAIPGPIAIAKSLVRLIDSGLEAASAKPLVVYAKDGFLWSVDALHGGAPVKLWPEATLSYTVAENGLVAFQPESEDPAQGDLVVVPAWKPGKAKVKLAKAGYDPTISPDGTMLAYVRPLERFTKTEIEELNQPDYCVSYIFVAQPAGGIFQQMAAQQKLETIRQGLDRGGDFAALARQYSEDPETAAYGGKYACGQPRDFKQGFGDALVGHHQGEILGPLRTSLGWYFISVTQVIEGASRQVVPPKQTAVVIHDLATGTERELPYERGQYEQNWNDRLGAWVGGGTVLQVWHETNFSASAVRETSEGPPQLWSISRGMLTSGADVMVDGKVVETGDGGEFTGLFDPGSKNRRRLVEKRRGEIGGAYAVSPSRSKLAYCVERGNGLKQPKTVQLWVWLGAGEPLLLDEGREEGVNFNIGGIRWADESRLVYEKGNERSRQVWTTGLSPGSARAVATEGFQPRPIPGGAGTIVYATGEGDSLQWWSGNLTPSPPTKVIEGVREVAVTRVVRLGPGIRRTVGFGVVGLLALLVAALLVFSAVVIGRRVRRVAAVKAVTHKAPVARFCKHCGAQIRVGINFCPKCGKPVA